MDWLILLLLVPAILVPLVLLCGFAGCSQKIAFGCEDDSDCPPGTRCVAGDCVDAGSPFPAPPFPAPPSAPEGLTAIALSDSDIALSWNDDPDATDFQIERGGEDEEFAVIPRPLDQTRTSATDTGLAEGTFFRYQIRAINAQGPSEPSNEASATTLWSSFQPVLSDPFVTLGGSEPHRGDCIVQRIGADSLLNRGARVRITLQGPATGSLTLLNVTISHANTAAGADPFDSEAQPTHVAQDVVIAAGVDETIPSVGSVAFNLDNTRPLLIAFDVSDQAGQFRVSFGQRPDAETQAFINLNAAEALTQDRTGFNAVDGAFYLIKQIEVL